MISEAYIWVLIHPDISGPVLDPHGEGRARPVRPGGVQARAGVLHGVLQRALPAAQGNY